MSRHSHGHELDERGSGAGARAIGRPCERRGHLVRVGPVDRDSGDAVASGLVGEHAGRRLLRNGCRERRLIVLDAEHRGQLPRGAQVDRLVPLAERRTALANERERDARVAFARERHRDAGNGQRADRQRRRGRQDSPFPVADVQIAAVHRRTGLGHLRVEDHSDRGRLGPHRKCDAKIADDGADDVALPAAVGVTPLCAALQPDAGSVDGLLSERPEPFSLKRNVAEFDLAAEKELLETIVNGASQHHPAQDLAAFIRGQRRRNRFTDQEAVAGGNELVACSLQPLCRRDSRRRVGQAVD